jgi:hypothetical protein
MQGMLEHDHGRPPLPPPRYSLRTLLLGITACGLFFGAFWWFSPSVVIAGAVAGLMVAAHVVGNSLGTQLRDRSSQQSSGRGNLSPGEVSKSRAPTTHLGERWSLGWGMILPTAAGALTGMLGGCWWLESTYHLGFDPAGLTIAALACGTLGGCAAFGVATFSQVLFIALWQALRHK